MTLDRVAVIPSVGIGDALIMMVASHRFYTLGYKVDTYTHALNSLKDWFEGHHFIRRPPLEDLENIFAPYDLIILQNDNSAFAKKLISLHEKRKIKTLSVFYPSYEKNKHSPLRALDRVFNDQKPMVDNIASAISSVLGLNNISKNNGLFPPHDLIHRKYKHRVLIHPTSSVEERTWHFDKFLSVAHKLLENGYKPVFCVSPKEREKLKDFLDDSFDTPEFESLSDLASFAYESGALIGNESGTAHLCSNLHLPTVVVSGCKKRIRLWRPGWYKGSVITPSTLIPNLKGSRLREKKWKSYVFPSQVLSKFNKLTK